MSLVKRLLEAGYKRYDLRQIASDMYQLGASRADIGRQVGRRIRAGRSAAKAAAVGAAPGADPFVGFVLTGYKELDDMFKAMSEGMQKKALRPAARTVAKMVLEQAKSEVPEDTGLLRSELRIKAKKRSRRYPHTVGMTVGFADDLFKGDTFYAGFMEFGTTNRYQKKRKTKQRYTGKIDDTRFAFLRPSLWSYPERKQAIFRQALITWLNSYRAKNPDKIGAY
jgi:HK97 gp10 family phage protein